jgi:hypothetical protein
MQYQTARSELQSRPPRVSFPGIALEALTMVSLAALLSWWL